MVVIAKNSRQEILSVIKPVICLFFIFFCYCLQIPSCFAIPSSPFIRTGSTWLTSFLYFYLFFFKTFFLESLVRNQ